MKAKYALGLALLYGVIAGVAPAVFAQNNESTSYLAKEDTFSFDAAEFDTLSISAERISVEEIIRAIGERMEADQAKFDTYESTVLMTMIARENDDPDCQDYTIFEMAERQRNVRGSSRQSVVLWERERKYVDGELEKEEGAEEEFQAEWHDIGEGLSLAVPFASDSDNRYRYELEDRHLVGNNVVYRIRFEPRNQFEVLPSGTVWVDYTDLVLRRIEARYEGPVPMPLFLKAVPFLRASQQKMGDYWVADEIHARADLRNLPLPDFPANVDMRVVVKDHVINGVAFNDDGTVKTDEPVDEGSAR